MIRYLLILLSIYFAGFSLATPVLSIPTFEDLNLKFAVDGGSHWGEQKRTIFLREKLFLSLDYEFSPKYEMRHELFLEFRKGSFQHLSNEGEGSPFDVNYSMFTVKDAFVKDLNLNVGFINQEYLDAPLLLYDRPFIGLQQEYFWNSPVVLKYVDEFKVVFQQNIPSTTIVVDRFSQLRGISSLFTASAFTSSIFRNQFHSKAHLTGFAFHNLSVKAAQHGGVNGNDLQHSNYGSKYANFRDPYWGVHANVGTRFNVFPTLVLDLEYAFLWNLGAFANRHFVEKDPSSAYGSRSRGDSVTMKFRIPVWQDKLFILGFESFRNQDNASVAFYSDSKYGGSARYGFIISGQILFKNYNVLLDLKYGVIQSYKNKRTLLQGGRNLNYFNFEIRTEYGKV